MFIFLAPITIIYNHNHDIYIPLQVQSVRDILFICFVWWLCPMFQHLKTTSLQPCNGLSWYSNIITIHMSLCNVQKTLKRSYEFILHEWISHISVVFLCSVWHWGKAAHIYCMIQHTGCKNSQQEIIVMGKNWWCSDTISSFWVL